MTEGSDEDLLAAIGADPAALRAFYLRHIAKVTGMGVRRFDQPEDVADFVANVFLEVLRSARGFDPGRGHAVAWLYGLGSNVASAMYRQQARTLRAEQQLQGRALLDADDYARVEERIDAAADLRRTYTAMQRLAPQDRQVLELVAVDGLTTAEAARALSISPIAARVRLTRARRRLLSAARGPATSIASNVTKAGREGWT
ncbi:RNA polymerase sigma-70 factor (ECF subfamily) [Kribbella sp. VKM Ac-2500]|uniref:RNA polymerase sigma factor n=1 Tax=Kribbella sp. VKM Ac-2500 TaxID=2512214 RepID=UPI001046D588|nr:sigma-70 family RNA polymerase sigma factor [Kribbella sp. VKM Ac-2500]TCN34457.1 RNA polymerase sigma-70 factor (ECF subfamily) [Kribbella sp. VKM Ac-2500]